MIKKAGVIATAIASIAFLTSGCACMHKKCVKTAPKQVKVEKPVTTTVKAPTTASTISQQQLKSIFQDIHFNFNKYNLCYIDKWGIKQNVPEVLDRIAQYMKKHPKIRIRIEGNCDERGTVEYNLVLGWKRAMAAKQYLVSKGISPDRIEIISYGKSRPLDPRHNPYAWAKNRRDHFVILSK